MQLTSNYEASNNNGVITNKRTIYIPMDINTLNLSSTTPNSMQTMFASLHVFVFFVYVG